MNGSAITSKRQDRSMHPWSRDGSASPFLRNLDGHGHDDGTGVIVPLEELDLLDRRRPSRGDHQVAHLMPPLEHDRTLRSRHVIEGVIEGEMDAVEQRMILHLAPGVLQPDDHGSGLAGLAWKARRKAPAADPAEEVDRPDGHAARHAHRPG